MIVPNWRCVKLLVILGLLEYLKGFWISFIIEWWWKILSTFQPIFYLQISDILMTKYNRISGLKNSIYALQHVHSLTGKCWQISEVWVPPSHLGFNDEQILYLAMKSTLTGSCYHVILIITVIYDAIGKNYIFEIYLLVRFHPTSVWLIYLFLYLFCLTFIWKNAQTITVYYLSTDVPLQLKCGVMKNKS